MTYSWDMSNATNLTFNANTSNINFTGNGSNTIMNVGAAKTFNVVNITGSGVPTIVTSGSSFGTLTRTGTNIKTDGLKINGDITVTGTLSLAGNSVTNRHWSGLYPRLYYQQR